jgi:hypothetical protein
MAAMAFVEFVPGEWVQTLYTYNYILSLDWFYLYNNCDMTFFVKCVYPNPPCQLSLWEETEAPGENPRLSAELCIFVI